MSRSKWKGPFISSNIIKIRTSLKRNLKSNLLIWSRNSIIPGFLINQRVLIHNGKVFRPILINQNMIGFKCGEFSLTRTRSNKKFKKEQKKK